MDKSPAVLACGGENGRTANWGDLYARIACSSVIRVRDGRTDADSAHRMVGARLVITTLYRSVDAE